MGCSIAASFIGTRSLALHSRARRFGHIRWPNWEPAVCASHSDAVSLAISKLETRQCKPRRLRRSILTESRQRLERFFCQLDCAAQAQTDLVLSWLVLLCYSPH